MKPFLQILYRWIILIIIFCFLQYVSSNSESSISKKNLIATKSKYSNFQLRSNFEHLELVRKKREIIDDIVLLHLYGQSDSATISSTERIIEAEYKQTDLQVWVASFIAMAIISSVGLLVVSAVPYLQKVSYTHVIQFLVALAVGSLTGDAMLHLLPHSIIASSFAAAKAENEAVEENEAAEKAGIYKGLVALSGIYVFFMAEKIVTLTSDYRSQKKANEEEVERAKHADRKPSTFNEWLTEDTRESFSHQQNFNRSRGSIIPTGLSGRAMSKIDDLIRYAEADLVEEGDQKGFRKKSSMSTPIRKSSSGHLILPDGEGNKGSTEQTDKSDDNTNEIVLFVPPPTTTIEKKVETGGGEHGHGHSHEIPQSVMSVAWMVIFGDGLHNFTDGLAIGAAFAKSSAGGISTALAVFCHELPHELGDFAVLLKTGMKVRQALCYNMLSSALSVIGMLIGIFLGSIEAASYWIFAITAGIFIYVALVDMLPQLGSAAINPGESRIAHFFIQMGGLTVGVGNMFIIAFYEDKMKTFFEGLNYVSSATNNTYI